MGLGGGPFGGDITPTVSRKKKQELDAKIAVDFMPDSFGGKTFLTFSRLLAFEKQILERREKNE